MNLVSAAAVRAAAALDAKTPGQGDLVKTTNPKGTVRGNVSAGDSCGEDNG